MKKFTKIIIIIFIFLTPVFTFAQEYELVSDSSKKIQTLFIDTKGVDINAIEGVIKIGNEDFKNINLSTEGSIVPIWLVNPSLAGKEIIFEGVLPGGFNGKAILFSFSGNDFKTELSGSVYLNDGLGTSKKALVKYREATTEEKDILNVISENIKTGLTSDSVPPEIFYPEVSTSSDIYEGQLFISFLTQDKQSGVEYYEVAEKRGIFKVFNYDKLSWQKAESPHLLSDQEGKSFVYIKAVDRVGNERIAVVPPLYTSLARTIAIVSTIIFLIGIVWSVLRKFINDKRNKNFPS